MKFHIYRKNQMYGSFRPFVLYVDGQKKLQVGVDTTGSLDLSPGKYNIQFKSWFFACSPKINIVVNKDEQQLDLYLITYYRFPFLFSFIFSFLAIKGRDQLIVNKVSETEFVECREKNKMFQKDFLLRNSPVNRLMLFLAILGSITIITITLIGTATIAQANLSQMPMDHFNIASFVVLLFLMGFASVFILAKYFRKPAINYLNLMYLYLVSIPTIIGLVLYNLQFHFYVALMIIFLCMYIYFFVKLIKSRRNYNSEQKHRKDISTA